MSIPMETVEGGGLNREERGTPVPKRWTEKEDWEVVVGKVVGDGGMGARDAKEEGDDKEGSKALGETKRRNVPLDFRDEEEPFNGVRVTEARL
ncbi:hypothetical protein P7K49_015877 [Saguinus oedipus]|uniref:Uncharacterized protein n=1 Tax=Saguinus oedipus TaxID=9490 RepID=A0ABQ9VAG8_SAGOE|nr:hypothetical protein P7K49_015877 [Saguinus oedipus]